MKRILIVGAVRNVAKTVEQIHMILERSFDDFERDYFLVESDSSDSTVNILQKMSRIYSNFAFISLGNLSKKVPHRTSRIATCRNEYLREWANRDSMYEYLVIADWDSVNMKLNGDAVNSCWRNDEWDVCTANQSGPYYDLWALRSENWLNYDCQLDFFINSSKDGVRRSYFKNFIRPMFNVERMEKWTRTFSSFGGIAIYKAHVIGAHKYPTESKFICEHVEFHRAMTFEGARIYINPDLVNSSWTRNAFRSCIEFFFYIIFGNRYNSIRNKRFYSYFGLKI